MAVAAVLLNLAADACRCFRIEALRPDFPAVPAASIAEPDPALRGVRAWAICGFTG